MCGFVGCFSSNTISTSEMRLRKAVAAIEHRGPDAEGRLNETLGEGRLSIGFRRLAILDRTTLADQPQSSKDGRFSIVFNGEIYNYVEIRNELIEFGYTFQSNGDTEVLVSAWHAWGEASLRKFIGMFAFVILDRETNELTCVRDQFGIKPLFYSTTNSEFAFSSEIQALRLITGKQFCINSKVAERYLITGNYDRSEETFFEGVTSVKPGHLIRYNLNTQSYPVKQVKWLEAPQPQILNLNFLQASEYFREEFLSSIRIHLRSDVKIATALSGGLDSSAIVAAIRYIEPSLEIDTFSFIANSRKIDETPWINTVNKAFNGKEHLIHIDKQDFYQDLDDLITCQGEPFGSTSIYAQYRVFKEARSRGITVMMDGQGADELFAGYFGYPESRLRSLIEHRELMNAASLLKEWGAYPDRHRSQLVKSYFKDSDVMVLSKFLRERRFRAQLPDFYTGNGDISGADFELLGEDFWKGRRLTERLQWEQSKGLLPSLLRHADRNSMRWSIESRVPFLTPNLSRIGLQVPEEFLLNQKGVTKFLLRESLRGIIPDQIIDRKDKIGFETPQSEWLSDLLKFKPEILDGVASLDFLNPAKTRHFLSSFDTKDVRQSRLFWRVINLARWNQLHF